MYTLKVNTNTIVKVIILLLPIFWAIPGFASNPVIEKVEVVSAPTPNPACAGTTVTAQLKIHLKDPDTNKEIDPVPDGTTFTWKIVSVTRDGSTADSSSASCSGGQTVTVTATYSVGGNYVINLHCDVANPAWKDASGNPAPPLTVDTSVSFTVTAAPAAVSVSLVKVAPSTPLSASGCDYGLTAVEGTLKIQITACQTNTGWQAILTSVVGQYSSQRRLLPAASTGVKDAQGKPVGQSEPVDHYLTNSSSDDDAIKSCDEVLSLTHFGGCKGSTTYILAAVNAHEDVHQAHLLPALQQALTTIQADVSKITPVSAPDLATAIANLQKDPAYNQAVIEGFNTYNTNYGQLSKYDHGTTPTSTDGPAYKAEMAITKSWIATLCNELQQSKIIICPSCAN